MYVDLFLYIHTHLYINLITIAPLVITNANTPGTSLSIGSLNILKFFSAMNFKRHCLPSFSFLSQNCREGSPYFINNIFSIMGVSATDSRIKNLLLLSSLILEIYFRLSQEYFIAIPIAKIPSDLDASGGK